MRQLWRSVTPWNVALAWWLAELVTNEPLKANPQEVESVHWFTVQEIDRLDGLLASNRTFLGALRQGAFELPLWAG
jgi:hypothetical protein